MLHAVYPIEYPVDELEYPVISTWCSVFVFDQYGPARMAYPAVECMDALWTGRYCECWNSLPSFAYNLKPEKKYNHIQCVFFVKTLMLDEEASRGFRRRRFWTGIWMLLSLIAQTAQYRHTFNVDFFEHSSSGFSLQRCPAEHNWLICQLCNGTLLHWNKTIPGHWYAILKLFIYCLSKTKITTVRNPGKDIVTNQVHANYCFFFPSTLNMLNCLCST